MTASQLSLLTFLIDLLLRVYFCLRIVTRRLPAGVSWAWISTILFMPLAGTLIYLFLGEYRLGSRRTRRLTLAQSVLQDLPVPSATSGVALPEPANSFSLGLRHLFSTPLTTGNEAELLCNADQAFPRLIADIEAARETCDMEFYIWSDGGRADAFGDALVRAASRGVTCRVLVDSLGSEEFLRRPMAKKLRTHGVQLRAALPAGLLRSLFSRPDLRLHRKIVVIDGEIAYTGSLNLADPLLFKREAGVGQWVDAFCRVRGPAVHSLHWVFCTDWFMETGESLSLAGKTTPQMRTRAEGGAEIQCLASGPAIKSSPIEEALIMAIYGARQEVVMSTPYFVPNEALLYALMSTARRGVRVILIVPKKVDSRLIQYASRAFLKELVAAGVCVALYRDGLLHTKSLTVDGQFSLFGSHNLDPRSLRINFEVSLAIYEGAFTEGLRALQGKYLRASDLLTTNGREPVGLQRLREDLARLTGPLL